MSLCLATNGYVAFRINSNIVVFSNRSTYHYHVAVMKLDVAGNESVYLPGGRKFFFKNFNLDLLVKSIESNHITFSNSTVRYLTLKVLRSYHSEAPVKWCKVSPMFEDEFKHAFSVISKFVRLRDESLSDFSYWANGNDKYYEIADKKRFGDFILFKQCEYGASGQTIRSCIEEFNLLHDEGQFDIDSICNALTDSDDGDDITKSLFDMLIDKFVSIDSCRFYTSMVGMSGYIHPTMYWNPLDWVISLTR